MLLWIVMLAAPFSFTNTIATRQMAGWLTAGALFFLYLTANPFLPAAQADYSKHFSGLNPLLQDIALIIHPPILYIGYTLSAVPFCIVSGNYLFSSKPQDHRLIASLIRPWVLGAWSFLTLGIALGSWWAYRELGWGGWWFWDPVENASLIPWLFLTALLHSTISTAKFGLFPVWTSLLVVLAFSSAVLGMFLTRSGLLVSVHAFASDPTRGLVLFGYFSLILTAGLCAVYQQNKTAPPTKSVAFTSRENFILLNNIMMLATALIILTATLWPLLDKEISIGAPFYNEAVVPLFLIVLPLMAVAVFMPWRHTLKSSRTIKTRFIILITAAILEPLLLQ